MLQTWGVLGEAGADLVEAIAERIDHSCDPLVPTLKGAHVRDTREALRTALVLSERLNGAGPAQRVIAWQHHWVFEDTAIIQTRVKNEKD